jgi:hypothetical protein
LLAGKLSNPAVPLFVIKAGILYAEAIISPRQILGFFNTIDPLRTCSPAVQMGGIPGSVKMAF